MKFARIDMLFLIWALPLLLPVFIYGHRKRRKILSRYSSPKGLGIIASDANAGRRWIKNGLILAALGLIAVALSGPLYGYRWEEIERKGIDIIVALDCSKSMLATDIKPTRLDKAKREIYDLLNMLKGDRIGLAAYSGTAFLQCPLTLDYNAFHIFLNTLTPDMLPVGGTDIGEALRVSLSAFDERSKTEKAIILITDGEHTGGSNPVEAAEALAKANVKLFAIGIGTDGGVPVPESDGGLKKDASGKIILSKLDEELLKKIAILTGGAYVRAAAGGMELDLIYNTEIRGKMEKTTLSGGRRQVWEDRYQWVLALAMLVFIAELFISSKKKGIMLIFLVMLFNASAYAGSIRNGEESYQKGEYEKALKYFIDAQLQNPDKPEIFYNIGNAYYKLEKYDEAANSFKQAAKSENRQLRQKALYNLGNADYRKGKLEDSVKHYEEVLKLDPNDTQAKENLEFAKKMIEQKKLEDQKKQEEQNKKDDKDGKEQDLQKKPSDDKKEDDKKNQDKPGEKGKSDINDKSSDEKKEKPEQGSEPEEDKGDKKGTAPDPKPDKAAENEAKTVQTDSADKKPDNTEGQRQAERALNRLTDQPGKAMIPAYQKRRVEKDW
ncbi:MAG: hypothetical protein BWK80_11675 [Desulfobacteraceae bacterium IS3]|nr:MAG: hypothetical protein BWK80_11675 [Desulfobacteraceae bacterium IS3]